MAGSRARTVAACLKELPQESRPLVYPALGAWKHPYGFYAMNIFYTPGLSRWLRSESA